MGPWTRTSTVKSPWQKRLKNRGLLTRPGGLHDPKGEALFNGIGLPSQVSEAIVREAKKEILTPERVTPEEFDAPVNWLR